MPPRHLPLAALLLAALVLAACDATSSTRAEVPNDDDDGCVVPASRFADGGVGKDGIPALTDPALVGPADATYLAPGDRVIGLLVEGRAIAVPHNILWWHEIANFNFGTIQLAVTYCPLTGSSLAFDRAAVGGGEFGVSGLLFQNNLTMYDRTTDESLWPQMNRAAGCGTRAGTELPMVPIIEATWAGWQALYPETEVVAEATGHRRDYTFYPYGNYETPSNASTLYPMPNGIDHRRPPKERVLGLPDGTGGLALPFGTLGALGTARVAEVVVGGEPGVVFWDHAAEGAMAYRPTLDGQRLTFAADGAFVDDQTGSTWRLDGQAVAGPLAGRSLEPVAEAYVAFWFAWAAFQPQTRIWNG